MRFLIISLITLVMFIFTGCGESTSVDSSPTTQVINQAEVQTVPLTPPSTPSL